MFNLNKKPESQLGQTLQEQTEILRERVQSLEDSLLTKKTAEVLPIKKTRIKIKDSKNRFKSMNSLYEYLNDLGFVVSKGYFWTIDLDGHHVEMNWNQTGEIMTEASFKKISERTTKMLSTVFGGEWTYSTGNRKGE